MTIPMTARFWSLVALFTALTLSITALPAAAQSPSQATSLVAVTAQVTQAEAELRAVDRALDAGMATEDRTAARAKALAAQQAVRALASNLEDQLGIIDARIAGLGPVAEGATEAPEIQRERKRMAQDRAAIDAAIKRGRLVEVEAQQLIDEMDRSRAEELNETLATRVHSPLTPDFWGAVLSALPRDMRRINLFLSQGVEQVFATWKQGTPWPALLGFLVAAALLFPLRIKARELGQRHLIGTAPGHRVRRSGFALWRLLVGTVAPTLAAVVLVQGLRWSALLPAGPDCSMDSWWRWGWPRSPLRSPARS